MASKALKALLFATLAALGPAHAQDAPRLKFLGISVGTPGRPLPICARDEIGVQAPRRACWIDRPFRAKNGDLLGQVQFPNDGMPAWAIHGATRVHASKSNAIKSIMVNLPGGCSPGDANKVAASISARFGSPEAMAGNGEFLGAEWLNEEGHVRLTRSSKICTVEFQTLQAREELLKELAERKRRQDGRPLSP